jgi:signal peptidase II
MKRTYYIGLGAVVIAIDQLSKWLVVHTLTHRVVITSLLAFEKTINRGISWGLFYSESPFVFWPLTSLIMVLTGGLIFYAIQQAKQGLSVLGLTLVCAGSLSNIIDRVLRGGVIDFIECSWGTYVWPNFNIADICIVLGVCIMLIEHARRPQ